MGTLICCLGLFGLAAITAQRRQKEIGIRKVVGASTGRVAVLLSWWAMQHWLEGFAYRIDVGASVFLLAAGAVLVITMLTIGFQVVRAAVMSPVRVLRSE